MSRIKTTHYTRGISVTEWRNSQGEYHREPGEGPAWVMVSADGTKMQEAYYTHGLWHREDGPAVCVFWPDGTPLIRRWYQHGKLHRIHGPAYEMFNEEGTLIYTENWVNGVETPTSSTKPAVTDVAH